MKEKGSMACGQRVLQERKFVLPGAITQSKPLHPPSPLSLPVPFSFIPLTHFLLPLLPKISEDNCTSKSIYTLARIVHIFVYFFLYCSLISILSTSPHLSPLTLVSVLSVLLSSLYSVLNNLFRPSQSLRSLHSFPLYISPV